MKDCMLLLAGGEEWEGGEGGGVGGGGGGRGQRGKVEGGLRGGGGVGQKQPVCPSPGEHKQIPCIHTTMDCAHEAVSKGANRT